MEMLDETVRAIRAGKQPNLDAPFHHGAELNLGVAALIPDDYIGDVHTRLVLYKRIAGADGEDALRELQVEMIDRFGLLPPQVQTLFRVTELKLRAEHLGILRIDASATGGRIEFASDTSVDPLALIKLVQQSPQRYRMDGGTRLRWQQPAPDGAERLALVDRMLALLRPADKGKT
jgi:transcription-repair coupling factor (superfamily II helicase)